jgi:hypothetical protein
MTPLKIVAAAVGVLAILFIGLIVAVDQLILRPGH